MTIEIHTHAGPVNGGLIGHLESELSRLHRMLPRLSRADVHFRLDEEEMPHRRFLCSIAIEAYGNDFMTLSHREDWPHAIEEALEATEGKVRELAAADREPPEEILSTVKV
jgi:hypothetical protein